MNEFARIDPTKGPHAAADLTDDQVYYLAKLLLWEMSVRLTQPEFEDLLVDFGEAREHLEEVIVSVRAERDRMAFEADVLADLEHLPVAPREAA